VFDGKKDAGWIVTFQYPMRLRDSFPAGDSREGFSSRATWTAGALLLILYLLAGVAYSAWLAPVARYPDEDDYLKLSYNLLHGPGYSMDGVHLTASRPPGYVFFLSVIRAMGGDFFSFRVVQFLALGATILLISRLGSDKGRSSSLVLVTGLVICYPLLFYISGILYPQILSGFLFILALVFILENPRGPTLNLAAGLTFGALILVVPTFLFTFVVVLGTAYFLKIVRWRDILPITLAVALVIGSWTARNAVVFHRFVPIASSSGMNFLEGNNPQATPKEAASNVAMNPYYQEAARRGLDEFQTDQFFKDTALTWIKTHPGDALVLYFEKVLNFFNISNVYSYRIQGEASAAKQVVLAASYLLLLALLGWRLVEIKRFPLLTREKLFLIVYILSAFTSAIFFTRIRHRLPYDYLIITVIALHISRRLELWIAARRSISDSARTT